MKEHIEFLIYCIEICKDCLHDSGSRIYKLFKQTGVLQLIYEQYEELHTMSVIAIKQYIIDALRVRGIEI